MKAICESFVYLVGVSTIISVLGTSSVLANSSVSNPESRDKVAIDLDNSGNRQLTPFQSLSTRHADTLEIDALTPTVTRSQLHRLERERSLSSHEHETEETLIGQEDIIEDVEEEVEEVDPGTATRSSPSYIGVGLNVGLGDGGSSLGDESFLVLSKIGLLPYLSVRPSVAIEDDVTILLPVTYDFAPDAFDFTEAAGEEIGVRIAPYLGAGIAINTEDDASVDFLTTAGVDVPFSEQFTGIAAVSVSLFDDPAVGLQLGVGYNFR